MPRDSRGLGNFLGVFRRFAAVSEVTRLLPRLLRTGVFIIDSNYFRSRQNTSILATQRYRGGVTSFFVGAFEVFENQALGSMEEIEGSGCGNKGIAVFAVFAERL
jgi:hypothetical protein